jgi:hypothetical protein
MSLTVRRFLRVEIQVKEDANGKRGETEVDKGRKQKGFCGFDDRNQPHQNLYEHANEPVFSNNHRFFSLYILPVVCSIFHLTIVLLTFTSMTLLCILKLVLSLVSSARSFSTGWVTILTGLLKRK